MSEDQDKTPTQPSRRAAADMRTDSEKIRDAQAQAIEELRTKTGHHAAILVEHGAAIVNLQGQDERHDNAIRALNSTVAELNANIKTNNELQTISNELKVQQFGEQKLLRSDFNGAIARVIRVLKSPIFVVAIAAGGILYGLVGSACGKLFR